MAKGISSMSIKGPAQLFLLEATFGRQENNRFFEYSAYKPTKAFFFLIISGDSTVITFITAIRTHRSECG